MLLIWRDYRLEGTGEVTAPVVTQVHHTVLAPAQLLSQFRFTYKAQSHRDKAGGTGTCGKLPEGS